MRRCRDIPYQCVSCSVPSFHSHFIVPSRVCCSVSFCKEQTEELLDIPLFDAQSTLKKNQDGIGMKIFCQNWSTYKTAPNCPLSANLQHKLLRLLHEIELGTIVMWLQLSWLQHMVTWYLFPHALCMLDVTYFEYVGSVISPADYVVVSTFFHRRKPTLKCFPLL